MENVHAFADILGALSGNSELGDDSSSYYCTLMPFSSRCAYRRAHIFNPCLLSCCVTQVIYISTGRVGLVTCALIAFVALSVGMWLFTLVTPAFYWFGVPAAFFIFYTATHCAFVLRGFQNLIGITDNPSTT